MSAMHGEGDSNRAIFSTLHGCLAIITNVHHSSQECIAGLQRPCLRERHAVERVSPASHVKICSNTFIHCPDLQSLPGSWSICLSGITAPDLYCGPKTLPAAAPHQLQAAPCDNLLACEKARCMFLSTSCCLALLSCLGYRNWNSAKLCIPAGAPYVTAFRVNL